MDLSQVQLPLNCIEAYAMHCGVDGHDKDWIGCITQSGHVCSWWGRTGARYQTAQKVMPRSKFYELLGEKNQKGYLEVDHWEPNSWKNYMFVKPSPIIKQEIKQDLMKEAKAPDSIIFDF